MTEENATQDEEPEVVAEETDESDVEAHALRRIEESRVVRRVEDL